METNNYTVAEVRLTYRNPQPPSQRVCIKSSSDAYKVIIKHYPEDEMECKEFVKILLLNTKQEVLGCIQVAEGGLKGAFVDIRNILQAALLTNASGIILVHNHPSGSVQPSKEDHQLTKAVENACNTMDIFLCDHLIISAYSFFSFTDELFIPSSDTKSPKIVSEKKIFKV